MSDTETSLPSLTEDAILAALAEVKEPATGRGLTELKLVTGVAIDGPNVALAIDLLSPITSNREAIERDVRAALADVPGVSQVSFTWNTKVRASGSGRSDAQPIQGVKNTIAVASGKGGVGKSTVAVNLAVSLARAGAKVGLLDADVYGPSIPLMMGVHEKPLMRDNKIVPLEAYGVKLMSIGFILDSQKALIWRGPLVAQLINQFLNDVLWGDLDYLVVDLPPGTGDVQLTLVQKIPIAGAVIVTTPQEVALADAVKGLKMFQEVKTPILGIVENMSWFVSPETGTHFPIFGEGGGQKTADAYEVELLAQVPIEMGIREGGDSGAPMAATHPDSETGVAFAHLAERVANQLAVQALAKPRKPTIMLRTVR
ncbi:MAG TPA: iron-sulfur cluster carrier protein ApbC [Thermomicrobiales bacterium]|nr:iron-sulfur cluster carrier protein ApbC [Thermomicrobiales bacterium]